MHRLIFSLFLVLCLGSNSMAQVQNDSLVALSHQFDFWLGEWDVYKTQTDTIVGDSFIESINDSTAIQEHYKAVGSPYKGTSLNKYNFLSGQWEQYWIDNGGLTLHLSGGLIDGKMVLENEMVYPQGKVTNRITWSYDDTSDTVRQVWEQGPDGETLQVVFDGTYKRKNN